MSTITGLSLIGSAIILQQKSGGIDMKGFKEILTSNAQIMRHLAQIKQETSDLEIQDMSSLPFGFSEGEDVQIERFCRMISYGVSTPFPRSQQQLAYAVIGIKNALKMISLVELIHRKPSISKITYESMRPDIKPIKQLDSLLQQPLMREALPNLRQAARFMHEKDQQEILDILKLKLRTL